MGLIELLVYIAILATFISGAVFSAYSVYVSLIKDATWVDQRSEEQVVSGEPHRDRGFVAISSALFLAAAVFTLTLALSQSVASRYEIASRGQDRLIVRANANACLNYAAAKIEQDYFYTLPVGGESLDDFNCRISSIDALGQGISVIRIDSQYKGVQAHINATTSTSATSTIILDSDFRLF